MTAPAGGTATGGPDLELVLLDEDGRPHLVLSDPPSLPPGREPGEPAGRGPGDTAGDGR